MIETTGIFIGVCVEAAAVAAVATAMVWPSRRAERARYRYIVFGLSTIPILLLGAIVLDFSQKQVWTSDARFRIFCAALAAGASLVALACAVWATSRRDLQYLQVKKVPSIGAHEFSVLDDPWFQAEYASSMALMRSAPALKIACERAAALLERMPGGPERDQVLFELHCALARSADYDKAMKNVIGGNDAHVL